MEKKDLNSWDKAVDYLETAALYPQRRDEMITRALQELLIRLPAVGMALVWHSRNRNTPLKVYYAGRDQQTMRHWLEERLDPSLNATLGILLQELGRLANMPIPHLISLQPAPSFPAGLWIVWTPLSPLSRAANDCLEKVRETLEALIEVESSEKSYFSNSSPLADQAMIEALRQGDSCALSVFLSLTRLAGNADLTFWGRAYPDVVETKDHLGAKNRNFAFVVERGKGIGGLIAAHGVPITVNDYRKSEYRHPSVAAAGDSEQVRSGVILPVRYRTGEELSEDVSGVLYVVRRTVKPFSLAERLLVQRLTQQLEPLRPLTRPFSLFWPGLPSVADQKEGWYKVVLRADQRA